MRKTLIATLALFGALPAAAEVSLPTLIDNGMVLQRDTSVPIWGRADPGEPVSVEFQGWTFRTTTSDEGRWQITLPEMPAGGPHELIVRGEENEHRLTDVLFGDVWLASGQSNMELTMARTKPLYGEEMATADYPRIRYFEVPDRYDFDAPRDSLEGGQWQSVNPETLPGISAVSYFFARALHQSQEVPVAVINAALGGSPVEAWLSEEALEDFPSHLEEAKRWRDDDLIERTEKADQQRAQEWYAERDRKDPGYRDGEPVWADPGLDDSDWDSLTLPGEWGEPGEANGVWWLRKTITLPEDRAGEPAFLELGRIVDADVVYLNGQKVGETGYQYPPRWYQLPEDLLRAGENTIAVRLTSQSGQPAFVEDKPYELRLDDRAIDLTGEWKLKRGAKMAELEGPTFIRWKPLGLYNAMIAPLRRTPLKGAIWYQGESNVGRAAEYAELFPALVRDWRRHWDGMPFYFAQLANFLEARDQPTDSDWARLREAQESALALPHTGMAVTIDVGEWNDIHPLDKQSVGERLARQARAGVYGEDILPSGPRFAGMTVADGRARLRFDRVGEGLMACDGKPLDEFAIAGEDRQFVWARAEIVDDRVEVYSDEVATPVAVRYAWADNPDGANLCNRTGLPAAPFRTDDWPQAE